MKIPRKRWRKAFGKWFKQVLEEAGIIDYRYPVKGCGVWLPYGFKLRETILNVMKKELNVTGHQEVLFPLLIPGGYLRKEAEHIRGFENESFWVTRGGKKRLAVNLALRPTSETAITPMVKLWARSHAQLPVKLYQIVSVFRYETKATKPLLRVREVTTFKEAHTFHATHEEAGKQVEEAIGIYRRIFDELGIPYLVSKRPDWDKFAGAVYSIAFDTVFPDGKVVQIGTVHDLGQNFSRAFNATFETLSGDQDYYWQTSYGISERIVASVMAVHGDDHGLALPPSVAPIQVMIIPIPYKGWEDAVYKACKKLAEELNNAGIRAEADLREDVTPGSKYYDLEMRGIPVRIDVGPKEVESETAVVVKRDTLDRKTCKVIDLARVVKESLNEVQENLKRKAWRWLHDHVRRVKDLKEGIEFVNKVGGIIEVPYCGNMDCGKELQDKVGLKVLGVPVDGFERVKGRCPNCGKKAEDTLRLAKTY
jgi:prolyl-tRNA synthetase